MGKQSTRQNKSLPEVQKSMVGCRKESEMNIKLTKKQHEMLQPMFDKAYVASGTDRKLSILAQVWEDKGSGVAFIEARLLDYETIIEIQKITGVSSGAVSKSKDVWLEEIEP